jgi:hypothetical protein
MVMPKDDEDAARLPNRHGASKSLEELQAETRRLYDEMTTRTQRNRAHNKLLKPVPRKAKKPRRT